MEKEDYRYKHYHDLLDSLAAIVRQTEEPRRNIFDDNGSVFYGYNHRHAAGEFTPNFPLHEPEMSLILHADILSTLDYLREIHPFASTHLLVALCSLCLQYNFNKSQYETSELCKKINNNCSLIEIAQQLLLYCARRGKEQDVCKKRRVWELSLLCQREVELDEHLNFEAEILI